MSSSDEENNYVDDEDENTLCKYGTQLPQFEETELPSKKPIHVEDMIVKDENGKRRFHGAFTGGFSAGYWNTVGSKEGFTPSEFKSTRSEKTTVKKFQPKDFMDDEDFSEFGIAPQKIINTEDFGTSTSNSAKRKREPFSSGPIPGDPVLKNLLKPVHDKAAVRMLKKMGWRENQGVGSRMTFREKKKTIERNQREMYIKDKYSDNKNDEDDDDMSDEEITFAPDDFDPFIAKIKDNSFGLGYSGLQSTSSKIQHVNLFQSFQVIDKNNRKFSIKGQAFGVGAMEDEDEDIYAGDDLSNYDRTLDNEVRDKKRIQNKPIDASIIEGFSRATINDCQIVRYSIDVPRNFEPRNWLQRKSRFAPLDKEKAKVLESSSKHKVLGLGRHDLKPEERGALLNEKKPEEKIEEVKKSSEESAKKIAALLTSKQFVSENSSKTETFKPFIGYPEKQERYEKFLQLKSSDEKEIDKLLNDIQPLSMSSFDREMEKKEFIQAKRMYQPLDSLIGNRFIKEVDIHKEEKKVVDSKGVIRTKSMWKPNKKLCKLFNIPEPFGGMMFDEEEEKKNKKKSSSLFDYIGVPINSKSNFVTPQIIPRKLTEDNRKQIADEERKKSFLSAIEKEKSFMNKRAAAKDFFEDEQSDEKKKPSQPIQLEAPKTELEKKVAESINKKPEEKKDLFKAIFCDSDDEDEEEDGEKSSSFDKDEASLSEKQKSTFIESFLSTKNASEINILRNRSPPRGIFKNIFEMSTTSKEIIEIPQNQREESQEEDKVYGPALPKTVLPQSSIKINSDSSSSPDSSIDEKLLKKLKKAKSSSREKWVEKDKLKKSKKSKKKKSHKKSHKKHKSRK